MDVKEKPSSAKEEKKKIKASITQHSGYSRNKNKEYFIKIDHILYQINKVLNLNVSFF